MDHGSAFPYLLQFIKSVDYQSKFSSHMIKIKTNTVMRTI